MAVHVLFHLGIEDTLVTTVLPVDKMFKHIAHEIFLYCINQESWELCLSPSLQGKPFG